MTVLAITATTGEQRSAGPSEEHEARPPNPDARLDQPSVGGNGGGAVAGERRAREQLLTEIHPMVLRYCRGRLGRQETVIGSADDVAQEICLAVVNALGGYTVKGLSFRAFVYGIAAHKVTDAFRAIGRNRTEPMAELPTPGPPSTTPSSRRSRRAGAAVGVASAPAHPPPREVLICGSVGAECRGDGGRGGSTPGAVRFTHTGRSPAARCGVPDEELDDALDAELVD